MEDDTASDRREGALVEGQEGRGDLQAAGAVLADLDVPEVPGVVALVVGSGVIDFSGVEVATGGGEVFGAAVADVVDVEAGY